MTAQVVGPGGQIDVSDRVARQLGRVLDANEAGAWGYRAGESGTVDDLPAGARVLGIAAIATAPGATVTIDAGAAIPVPEDVGWEAAPRGNLVAPEIVFAGTASYFVEFVE